MKSAHPPRSWVLVRLGEIAQPTRPRHHPRDYPALRFVGMEHVEAHTMRLLGTAPAESMKSSAVHFQSGDVLYGRLRPYLNKVFQPNFEGLCSAEFIVFPETDFLNSKYLQYLLNSAEFVAFASHLNAGDRPRVDFDQIGDFEFPLAPLSEQERIVAEIEKQFTRLDTAVAALKRIQANLKRYRAAVLKAACEGRLVPTEAELARREGRSYETASVLLERILAERRSHWKGSVAKYPAPKTSQIDKMPRLPGGWIWASLDHLMVCLRNGISQKPDAESGQPILRISAVRPMKVDLDDVRFLSGRSSAYSDYILDDGDLLFTRYNGNPAFTGVCGAVRNPTRDIVHPDKLIRAKVPRHLADPHFLELVLNSGESRRFLASRIRTTAGQAGVSGADVRCIPVPLAPFAEQRRIALEADRRLTILEEAEVQVSDDLSRSERLRQAILKRAFEGKLVPQDPSDERASVFLERIRAVRDLMKNEKSHKSTASRQKKAKLAEV
ncbi:MAG: restriction endonuclease subunit S [Candidatus Acidiferrales bacterium]